MRDTAFSSMPNKVQLSIIAPCYNEQEVLIAFHRRLSAAMRSQTIRWEVIYVNDGSKDKTDSLITRLSRLPHVRCLHLSRNFGKEAALAAGVDHACGEAVLFMDVDLQDPPELVPNMIAHWQAGYDVVNMQRSCRAADPWMRRLTAGAFYALMRRMNKRIPFPANVSDFRLLGSRALAALRAMPERSRMLKGMVGWIGYATIEVQYLRESRSAGKTKWQFFGLLDLAIEGIISFSRKPLRCFTLVAAVALLVSLGVVSAAVVADTATIEHWIMVLVSLCAVGVAMLGEYVGIIVDEVKQRPTYLLSQRLPPAARVAPPVTGCVDDPSRRDPVPDTLPLRKETV